MHYPRKYGNYFQLVLGIGQNFIVDHRFCKTDRSSTPMSALFKFFFFFFFFLLNAQDR